MITEPPVRRSRRSAEPTPAQALREAITPYIALPRLRRLVAEQGDLYQALRCPTPPQDVLAVLELLRAMLQPNPRDQIKSPTDAAGLLMLDMSALDQEHLRTVLLDTKNRVQTITTVYVGSVNTAMIGHLLPETHQAAAAKMDALFSKEDSSDKEEDAADE